MDMLFNGKSALAYFGLDLQDCYITPPARKQYIIDIPGADGAIDLMQGMGPARYSPRTITATFSISAADARTAVDRILADLEGRTVPVVLPDDPTHYMTGTVHMSGAGYRTGDSVQLVITCAPWRYAMAEVVHSIPASESDVTYTWENSGTREAVPEVTAEADVRIVFGAASMAISAGTYLLTALTIAGKGSITVSVSGGAMTVRYREAIL